MYYLIDPASVQITLGSGHTVHESDHADPLDTTNEPRIRDESELLASQVQAFLEASEDVDADAETIEDILQALLVDKDDIEDTETRSEGQMNEDGDSDGELDEPSTQELDISPLFDKNYGFLPFSSSVPFCPVNLYITSDGHMVKARSQANASSSQGAWLVIGFRKQSSWRLTLDAGTVMRRGWFLLAVIRFTRIPDPPSSQGPFAI